jgi:phosphopantetheinyl transferase (holo-ACP synthase)
MLTFLDIEITNNPDGKPIVTLSQEAKAAFNNPEILLSLSHSKSHAMATAISK